ncbi:hypothetical protein N7519_006764 [Penicillium mononematosum]|uniref:uncharacterized protein n=1 Tax=Penicillium mononematosum TaxID=268346 RepID=UPI0025480D01|nr:uncharacterized protein N7519_006764 [Penicillium mononematosum]KAJ6185463.1 hypothetical protein N7519_006764 [Penicillium mononematosum]
MENHAWRSASPGLSSSEDDTDIFVNEQTGTNNTTGSRHVHSHATLEIIQAHLDADAESDSSEASGPRVHPDFFVHLENLRRVNEANRVNARREAEAWYEAALMPSQYQHEAPRIITTEANSESSQFVNQFNQPSYHASTENGLQPSAMGMSEQYETQDPTAAGPFQPMPPHVRFETPDSAGHVFTREHSHHHRPPSPYPTANPASHVHTREHSHHHRPPSPYPTANPASHVHTRDRSHHHRPPSPYPTAGRGQRYSFRNYAPTASAFRNCAATTSTPQPQGYTEHGNPYRIPFEPAPFPEDAVPYDPERILQAWLVRQQLIAGVRPEDIQPMGQSSGSRHRTPPYIVLNDSGAHIIRIEPARFEGAMLPLPALPWLPRRPNNSHSAPASLNTQNGSGPSTGPSIMAAPDSANILNLPVGSNMPTAATNSPVGSYLPTAVTISPVGSNPPAAVTISPVGSNQPAAATLMAAPALPANYDIVSDSTFIPEQISEDLNEDVAESESSDSRMVAFFQHLRLHEHANSVSVSMPDLVSGPSRPEPGSSENSQAPVVTPPVALAGQLVPICAKPYRCGFYQLPGSFWV